MDVNKTIGKNEEIGYLAASALGNPPEEARTMVIPNLGYRNVDSKAYVPTGHETESGQKEHPEVGGHRSSGRQLHYSRCRGAEKRSLRHSHEHRRQQQQ